MTKIGRDKLRMSDGSVRKFKSGKARSNFERVAEAVKHGFKPTGHKRGKTPFHRAEEYNGA